eukprot:6289287-Ditylum_brightwellii.AAC.1
MHTTLVKILPDPCLQLLCDMRHEDHCHPAKGTFGQCTKCQLECTSQDIVNNAMNRWENMSTGGNHA